MVKHDLIETWTDADLAADRPFMTWADAVQVIGETIGADIDRHEEKGETFKAQALRDAWANLCAARRMRLPDEISITWHIDDIKGQDSSLTDDQARDILHELKHKHDANVGICWEVIDIYIENFKRELNK